MLLKSLKFVALAAALLIHSNADAGAIIGSQGFSVVGTTTTSPNPMSVATATSFFMTGVGTTGSQTGDFIGLPNGFISDTTLNVASLGSFSFGSTDFGIFQASLGAEIITGNLNTREFRFLGSFAPGTNSLLSGFDPNSDAGVLLNFNQSGGIGNAIAVSWTLEMPTGIDLTPVPEPSSLAIMGFSMFGMAWYRRRRSGQTNTSISRG